MTIEAFEFTELRMNTPLDNLTAALSIIQTQILAADTDCKPETLFGPFHFSTGQLEVAVALLTPLLGPVEDFRWRPQHG